MQKHLLLLFLSDAKIKYQTGELSPAAYEGVSSLCYTTNEASVKMLVTGYKDQFLPHTLDRIFVFTSDKVRQPINQTANNPKVIEKRTAVELFKDDLRAFIPNIDNILVEQTYHENSHSSLEMQQTIVDMAKKIQDYVANYPEDNFILHADCTGGFRHAIMMTLDVVRLMQYSQVQTGYMMYSEYNPNGEGWVQNINSIYDLFDLTAGAEEFVRFGSVDAIMNYFHGKNISSELNGLLQSMKKFSDAIKVCHAGNFVKAIKELHTALDSFSQKTYTSEENSEVHFYDDLMHRLEKRIQKDYRDLWDEDDLQIISWCLEHDYLQQALTLYTERVPELVTDKEKGIFHLTDKGIAALKEQKKAIDKRSDDYYAFSVFDAEAKRKKDQEKGKKRFNKLIDSCLADCCKGTRSLEAIQEELTQAELYLGSHYGVLVGHLNSVVLILQKLDFLRNHTDILLESSITDNEIQRMVQVYINDGNETEVKKYNAAPYGEHRFKKLQKFFSNQVNDKIRKQLFPALTFIGSRQGWLCCQGYATTSLSLAELVQIGEDYNTIRDERNQSNHARKDKTQYSAEALKQVIQQALGHLTTLDTTGKLPASV